MTSEQILINRIKSGNRDAFREFVEQYKNDVYAMAYRLCNNHADADDLSQVIFIKFFRTVAKYRHETTARSWLYKIAVNSYIDKERKKVNKIIYPFSQDPGKEESFEETIVSQKSDPEESTESEMIRDHISKAMIRLSAKEKSVFILRHYHDQSIKEIAMALKTSEGTVKSLLFRGVKKLQQALSFYKPELGLGDHNG